jgi:hypothetical protein
MSDSPFRRKIAPSVPLLIEFTDETGTFSKTFRVAFDLNVLARVSEATGIQALTFELWTKMNALVLRAMLWSALIPYQPYFSKPGRLDDVGAMLDGDNQERAIEALWEAYLLYLPKDQREGLKRAREEAMREDGVPLVPTPATPAQPTPAQPAGSSSGPSADTISESATMAKSAD